MSIYTVAVRALAEFCYRSGDIDYRFTPSPTGVEGIEGHREIYSRRPASYQKEYALGGEFEFSDFTLMVRGRADGFDESCGYIEEIKTCRVERGAIPRPVHDLHWMQVMLYAALLLHRDVCRQRIEVRITWLNIDSGDEWQRVDMVDRAFLQGFLQDAVGRYGNWLKKMYAGQVLRDASITRLAFPFGGYRRGQREMAETVYKCIDQQGQLLLQAPTGIGKTAAVLYPALKAIAAGKHDVVNFVTARTVGRRAAEDTLQVFQRAGLQLCSLSLTAKETVCFSPGKACHGEDCPFASGYYDRLPAARSAALAVATLTREALEELAREFSVCPYQLASDMVPWVDVVIADIHHTYSFFAGLAAALEANSRRWSVLLDEAHNLPDRARSMYSAGLAKKDLMNARREADGGVRRALNGCNRVLLQLQKQDWQEADYHLGETTPAALERSLQVFTGAVGEQLALRADYLQSRPQLMDFYFGSLQFLRVLEVYGPDYRFEMQRTGGDQGLVLRLNCLDASRILATRQEQPLSVTAFSATLTPASWVGDALGFQPGFVFLSMPSPFQKHQMRVVVNTAVDTRFRARDSSLPLLCAAIENWLRVKPGNCIVYFPSYRYMSDALGKLGHLAEKRQLVVQERELSESARAQLLALLREKQNVVAFCILGGVFGEGIDLPGDDLHSVVIVGVGLPQFSRQHETQRDYFAQRYGRGFEYAYLYPGMQKVNQALGRVIRTSTDTGAALLLDRRYADPDYRNLLPPWWQYEDVS